MNIRFLRTHSKMLVSGIIIGGTMIVPGVSGGSMAMILGIYNTLITAISSFRKEPRKHALTLGVLGIGSLLGVLLLAKPLELLLQHYPVITMYFFMGAVAGGVPTIVEKTGAKRFSFRYLGYVLLGALCVLGIDALPISSLLSGADGIAAFGAMVLAGFIAAATMLLPGISGSYMLLLLGLYGSMIDAILNLQWSFLIPLALGMTMGLLVAARGLERALARYPGVTHLVILGFILGSLVGIFPGLPTGVDTILCPLALVVGGFAIWQLGKVGKTK